MPNEFLAPVSIGEAFDKITILRIKAKVITDTEKLANVTKELNALEASVTAYVGKNLAEVESLVAKLQDINQSLWDIEDDIRDCERKKDFGDNFIRLARAVYFTNDERAAVKKSINLSLGSALVEEKSYKDYG